MKKKRQSAGPSDIRHFVWPLSFRLLSLWRLWLTEKKGKRERERQREEKTSWPLLLVSLLTCLLNFLPNLLMELALSMSCSVVLLIGIVPSGHASPDKSHNWKFSVTMPVGSRPFGLSGGSCKFIQEIENKEHF